MKKVFSLMLLFATMLLLLTGCSKDEPDKSKLSQQLYSMYPEETQDIQGTNLSDVIWDSNNEFATTVQNNVITGRYVGNAIVRSTTGNLVFSVNVSPKYHTYTEPSLEWGASKSEIRKIYGAPDSEKDNALFYKTTNTDAPIMIFMFKNDGMYTCGVLCKYSSASQLGNFLAERYVPVDVDYSNYTATMLHCYGKISEPQVDYGVAMQVSSSVGGILVAYTRVNGTNSTRGVDIDYDGAIKSLENAMNQL